MIGVVTALRPDHTQRRLAWSVGLRVLFSLPVGRKRTNDTMAMTRPRCVACGYELLSGWSVCGKCGVAALDDQNELKE